MSLSSFYKNKKIFITGHTGFKGSWLNLFLNNMGAKTSGYSLKPKKSLPSLYNLLNFEKMSESCFEEIRNFNNLNECIEKFQPDIVFHLAAQPLVIK